ncbi:hypothetical protein DW886_14790 [Enterocloster aldenensis]|uniref:hypothetical protein n=1 Tax=Enterocloster aldenensis TaxID=358742 RepID=UPI000E51D144|nr:hypothetical protein DW886_14790 [Enterocloster aldenensis]
MELNIKRMNFKTRLCNSDDEPIDGTEEEKTVIYNADLMTEDELNELIISGWYFYDERVIVVTKTQADYLFGNPVSKDISKELKDTLEDICMPFCPNDEVYCLCRGCNDNKINGGSCSHCLACIDGEKAVDICDN